MLAYLFRYLENLQLLDGVQYICKLLIEIVSAESLIYFVWILEYIPWKYSYLFAYKMHFLCYYNEGWLYINTRLVKLCKEAVISMTLYTRHHLFLQKHLRFFQSLYTFNINHAKRHAECYHHLLCLWSITWDHIIKSVSNLVCWEHLRLECKMNQLPPLCTHGVRSPPLLCIRIKEMTPISLHKQTFLTCIGNTPPLPFGSPTHFVCRWLYIFTFVGVAFSTVEISCWSILLIDINNMNLKMKMYRIRVLKCIKSCKSPCKIV